MDIALHLPVAMSVRALLAIVAIMALAMMEASRERKELVKELRKVARRAGTSVAAEAPNGTRGSHQRGFEASAWLDAWLHARAAFFMSQ